MRARERDVKQSPLLLDVKLFGGLAFFHERCRKLEYARSFGSGEFAVVDAQHENLRKLESLGAMHGHQLHSVVRLVIFQADRAARLLVIVEVLHEFREAARIALRLPLLGEFCQARHVLAVLGAGALREFQPFVQIPEDHARASLPQRGPLLGNEFHQSP